MPNVSKPGAKRTEWRIDGFVFETRAFADGGIALFFEIDPVEANEIVTAGRILADQKAGRVVDCIMPIQARRDGRLFLSIWGNPPKGFGEPRAGTIVSVTVNLMPTLSKGGLWRLTAFPVAQRPIDQVDPAGASDSEPEAAESLPEPSDRDIVNAETRAPQAPETAPGIVSQRAVLAILPKPGLIRFSKPGSMPKPTPSLQPGRRRELYVSP